MAVADESGLVLASGLPSTENAEGLCGAIEIVYARVGTLIDLGLCSISQRRRLSVAVKA